MKFLATALGLASAANAHTLFTNLFIDGENQGDGTCVRQPKDASTANGPIYPITGDVMACGRDGNKAVNYICPAPGGAKLTFEFREHPNGDQPGEAIAEGHKGPCAVYVKKVGDMFSDSAAGDGWFKIWEDGLDSEGAWCVDRLRKNKGLLSVNLPTGLPSGYYLIRPEVLALHSALKGDPQFYTGCAQVFIESGPEGSLEIPEKYSVSIPGYVDKDTPGLSYNIYEKDLSKYPIPGPKVYIPSSTSSGSKQKQTAGVCPSDCLAKNANWCAKPIGKYSGQEACWAASKKCWAQADECWDSVPPSGSAGCKQWNNYCEKLGDECKNDKFEGPPKFTDKEAFAEVPGPMPAVYGTFDNAEIETGSKSGNSKSGENKPVSSAPAAAPEKTEAKKPAADKSEEKQTPAPVYVEQPDKTASPSKGELKVSEDGRCGGETGQTCLGSSFGDCCSKKGRCGRKTRHCTCGCQPGFGECDKN